MAIEFQNFKYSFINRKGKPVFAPSDRGGRIARELIPLIRAHVEFQPYYYHFSKGAHVAALHAHRSNRFFARIDLKNFFYTIGRNRVKSALKDIGIAQAERFAKWSTVKNPYDDPKYALPYGFSQSPILATLVLSRSVVGQFVHAMPAEILRSVYLDDIAISGNDPELLQEAFDGLLTAVAAANFTLNDDKVTAPATEIDLFNCELTHRRSVVSQGRMNAFEAQDASEAGVAAFAAYCLSVEKGNA